MNIKSLYRQARARGNTAREALAIARRHIDGPFAEYTAKMQAWNAEPDKRRYAAGGSANRPKLPELYRRKTPDELTPDGYSFFGFVADRCGLSESPDVGFYADTYCEAVYNPCVLIRRTRERNTWACVAAYWDSMAEDFIVDDKNVRDFARSAELFDESEFRQGAPMRNAYDIAPDARDAANRAYRLAESYAEDAREHDEKWQEASRHDSEREDARTELKDARADAQKAIAALRNQRATGTVAPLVCDMLRDKVTEARADMRRALQAIERETQAIESLGMAGEF